MTAIDSAMASVRRVREPLDAAVPALVHSEWARDFPWVVQGTTTRKAAAPIDRPFDLGLFSDGMPGDFVRVHWSHLLAATGMRAAFHARQVHGPEVRRHGEGGSAAVADGLTIVGDCDGHATSEPGLLLAVSAADCVPIFVVDPVERAVAVLHAGWRGAAAGILERGLDALASRDRRHRLHVHLGPAICGACYEVGPEVFEALALPTPDGAKPIDLRRVLTRRAIEAGVSAARITVSEHCTKHTSSGLFSHRAGDRGRQAGYVGIRVA